MIDIAADQTHENKVIPWFASKGRHGHPGKDYFARCSMGLTALLTSGGIRMASPKDWKTVTPQPSGLG